MPAATAARPLAAGQDTSGAAVGVLRWFRAGAVALTSSCLALLSHVAAGGALPRPFTLVLLLTMVMLVSLGLSGRRWTVGPLLAVLLGAQALVHVVAESGATAPLHAHHLDAASMGPQPSAAMMSAHAAAALLTALVLQRGDDWVWALAEPVARAWRAARLVTAGHRRVESPADLGISSAGDRPCAALRLLEHAVDRRGPPLRAVA